MQYNIPICDSREPPEIWIPFVTQHGWKREALPCGDFLFLDAQDEPVIIERKTVPDLIQSMVNGRLSVQAGKCIEASKFPILLVEGAWSQRDGKLLGTEMTWEQIWNYLQSLQDMGMRLQVTTSLAHTLERVHELRAFYLKGYHLSSQRSRSENPHIAALMQTPGVGYKKAKQLHEAGIKLHLDEDITVAVALKELPGIGMDSAERWLKFWNGE